MLDAYFGSLFYRSSIIIVPLHCNDKYYEKGDSMVKPLVILNVFLINIFMSFSAVSSTTNKEVALIVKNDCRLKGIIYKEPSYSRYAIFKYKPKALSGDVNAMYILSYCYGISIMVGQPIFANPLRRSKNSDSLKFLKLVHEDNIRSEFYWAKKAALKGHPGAMLILSALYDKHNSIRNKRYSKIPKKTLEWLTRSAKSGNQEAKEVLEDIERAKK